MAGLTRPGDHSGKHRQRQGSRSGGSPGQYVNNLTAKKPVTTVYVDVTVYRPDTYEAVSINYNSVEAYLRPSRILE